MLGCRKNLNCLFVQTLNKSFEAVQLRFFNLCKETNLIFTCFCPWEKKMPRYSKKWRFLFHLHQEVVDTFLEKLFLWSHQLTLHLRDSPMTDTLLIPLETYKPAAYVRIVLVMILHCRWILRCRESKNASFWCIRAFHRYNIQVHLFACTQTAELYGFGA